MPTMVVLAWRRGARRKRVARNEFSGALYSPWAMAGYWRLLNELNVWPFALESLSIGRRTLWN
jgi:hypothetical protein